MDNLFIMKIKVRKSADLGSFVVPYRSAPAD